MVPVGSHKIYMGNNLAEDVIGVGTYRLHMSTERLLDLYDTWNARCINVVSVSCLIKDDFDIRFSNQRVPIRKKNVIACWGNMIHDTFKLEIANNFLQCNIISFVDY